MCVTWRELTVGRAVSTTCELGPFVGHGQLSSLPVGGSAVDAHQTPVSTLAAMDARVSPSGARTRACAKL